MGVRSFDEGAAPKKALLDAVYLRKYIPFKDELETDVLDSMKLRDMAASFPSTTQHMALSLTFQNKPKTG